MLITHLASRLHHVYVIYNRENTKLGLDITSYPMLKAWSGSHFTANILRHPVWPTRYFGPVTVFRTSLVRMRRWRIWPPLNAPNLTAHAPTSTVLPSPRCWPRDLTTWPDPLIALVCPQCLRASDGMRNVRGAVMRRTGMGTWPSSRAGHTCTTTARTWSPPCPEPPMRSPDCTWPPRQRSRPTRPVISHCRWDAARVELTVLTAHQASYPDSSPGDSLTMKCLLMNSLALSTAHLRAHWLLEP